MGKLFKAPELLLAQKIRRDIMHMNKKSRISIAIAKARHNMHEVGSAKDGRQCMPRELLRSRKATFLRRNRQMWPETACAVDMDETDVLPTDKNAAISLQAQERC